MKIKFGTCLVLKKTLVLFFGLSLFLLPGQNYFLTLQSDWQPPVVRALDYQLPQLSDNPQNITGRPPPLLTAKAVYVVDPVSGVLLWQKNAGQQLLPASTVKIMTALVALEHYRLDEVLTVYYANDQGQDMGLVPGERMTFENLLYGLLVNSANDAAAVLAQNYPGGQTAFVFEMNKMADRLHLTDSYFVNPSGLNDDAFGNLLTGLSLTSARDLSRLSIRALKDPVFARVVKTPYRLVTDISGRYRHELYNINQLLGRVEGVKGVKTGWTEDAGECLVTYVEREGRSVVIVVMGSRDRFGESRLLIDWVYQNFVWQPVIPSTPGQ